MTDERLIQTVAEFREGILGDGNQATSMCFAVSWPLVTYLSLLGVRGRLTCGVVRSKDDDEYDHSHYWITLSDGRVLDATADQFGDGAIYLGPLPENYQETGEDVPDQSEG